MKLELKYLEGVDYPFTVDKIFGRQLHSEDADLNLTEFSDLIISLLRADAKRTLPPNTPFEVRAAIPGNFGRYKAYCWYYSPEMEKVESVQKDGKWSGNYASGCLKAGRFLT